MKKYLPLLEQNVQWLAVGLGVLFLLYMVYANVIAPPTAVSVNGATLSPGQVEEYITNNAVNELEQKSKDDPRVIPDVLNKDPKFVDVFPPTENPPALIQTAFPNLAVAVASDKTNANQGNNPQAGGAQPAGGQVVTALPTVPVATNLRVDARRANVNLAPPAPPQQDPNNPQATQSQQPADIDYVSVAFDVSMKEIAAEFRKTKIPAALSTAFLNVELIRQEQDDQGNWKEETVIAKLKNSDQPALPDEKNRNAVQGYIAWAESKQDTVLQPKFYDILKGDPWILPGEKAAVVQNPNGGQWAPRPANENEIRQGFNPATPPPDMTLAEKRAKYQYDLEKKRKEQQERNRNRPQPTPGGGGRGIPGGPGGRGGGGGMEGGGPGFSNMPSQGGSSIISGSVGPAPIPAPRHGSSIIPFQVSAAGGEGRAGIPGMPGMPGMPPGGPGYPYMPGDTGMMPQQQGPTGPVPCPTGAFDPRVITIDPVTGWAHDGSVSPGKTYRYKVRYSIKNPVFGATKIANPATLANNYQIVSKDSVWTAEVTIPERAYYYVAQANLNSGVATFEIYTFGNGQWNVSTFPAGAGDSVGSNKDGVDYTTGYTVVDVRRERNDSIVVLADAQGNLTRRNMRNDSSDPQREKLKQQMAAGTAAAAPAGGAAPGTGVPGMPGVPGFPDDRMPGGMPPPR